MSKIQMTKQLNLWLNWATYAVYGKMAQADSMMKKYRSSIHSAARDLMVQRPVDLKELYRGVVIHKDLVIDGHLPSLAELTFTSFSESFDVACWFGFPGSTISSFIFNSNPNALGFVAKHFPNKNDVLFHFSWAIELNLSMLATMHPDVEDPQQFDWYLRTQEEVILKHVDKLMVESIDNFECRSIDELNEMFTPPGF